MNDRESIDDLEARLRKSWREASPPPTPEAWLEGVMRDVRERAGEKPAHSVLLLERTTWRAAVAAAAVVLILAGLVLVSGAGPRGDLVKLVSLNAAAFFDLLLFF